MMDFCSESFYFSPCGGGMGGGPRRGAIYFWMNALNEAQAN